MCGAPSTNCEPPGRQLMPWGSTASGSETTSVPSTASPTWPIFEGWSLHAAIAATRQALLRVLVSCNTHRNADLLADTARTVDQISDGRVCLGIAGPGGSSAITPSADTDSARRGAGWIPGGEPCPHQGPRPETRPAAGGAPAHRSAVLDGWCAKVGSDPAAIERTVLPIDGTHITRRRGYGDAGATHLIHGSGVPFDLAPVERYAPGSSPRRIRVAHNAGGRRCPRHSSTR